jgi:hypothetical protein
MKLFVFLTTVLFAISLNAQVEKFQYQPDKVITNVVYHYVKTNIDGTHPENISIYVASKNRLEVFKFQDPGTRAGYVIAEMDWKYFHAASLESYAVFSVTEQLLGAKLKVLPGEKRWK